jgi:hypothetical protein
MSLPAWPGDYHLGQKALKDRDLLELIIGWESWDTKSNHAKEQIKVRRLTMLYSELDIRTS